MHALSIQNTSASSKSGSADQKRDQAKRPRRGILDAASSQLPSMSRQHTTCSARYMNAASANRAMRPCNQQRAVIQAVGMRNVVLGVHVRGAAALPVYSIGSLQVAGIHRFVLEFWMFLQIRQRLKHLQTYSCM